MAETEISDKEKLAENLMTFMPLMFKKLMKGFQPFDMPKQQVELLFMVMKDNGMPMSYYSEKMMVSKPNLTVIADKLIEDGLIERGFDPKDRRIIVLKITQKGMDTMCAHREKARKEMQNRLSRMEEKDLKRLNELIEEMKEIFEKLKSL